ncbi:MAG: PAS domain S-box protein [Chloroflexota bacterium]|nr:MAG: PAS domain S-box protein [Chloroflexota bacterium]
MRDNLIRATVGIAVALALLTIASLILFGKGFSLPAAPWFPPTTQAFIILSGLAVAVLCFGRFQATGRPSTFWAGLIFVWNGIVGVFYILAWPGVFGEFGVISQLPGTSAWLFVLAVSPLPFLGIAAFVHHPARLNVLLHLATYALAASLSALVSLLLVVFEERLPVIVIDTTFTPLLLYWQIPMIGLFALGAMALARRRGREDDHFLGYLSLFLTLLAFVMVTVVIAGGRYDLWWFASRFLYAGSYVALLFGLLQEGYSLYHAEQVRARHLALLNDVARALGTLASLEEVGQSAAEATARAMGAKSVGLFLREEGADSASLVSSYGMDQRFLDKFRIVPVDESSLLGQVIMSGRPGTAEVGEAPPLTVEALRALGARIFVAVPVRSRGRILGALAVSRATKEMFADEDVRLLSSIGDQIGAAVENARLFQQAQEARDTAERLATELNAVVETMAEGLAIGDRSGRVLRINRAGSQMFGFRSPEEAFEAQEEYRVMNVRRPDGSPLPFEEWPLTRALRGEERAEQEILLTGADGEERILSFVASPVRDQLGNIVLALNVFHDVTERRRAEAERERLSGGLEIERNRLLAVIGNASVGIVVSDERARVLLTNPEADRIYARPVLYGQEYETHAALQLRYPDGIPYDPRDLPLTRSALDGETFTGVDMVIVWPDGERRDLLVNSSPIRDGEGNIVGAVGVFQDITERKRAEAEREQLLAQMQRINEQLVVTGLQVKEQAETLADERRRLETILEITPVGVMVVDSQERVTAANPSTEFLLGVPKEQIGITPPPGYGALRPTGEPYPVEDLPLTRALRRGETSFGEEVVVTHANGKKLHLLASAAPIVDPVEGIIGAVVAFIDITPLRDLEQQREEFVSIIAHDLRNALTSVKGFADLMARPATRDTLPRTAQRAVEGISSGSRRLDRMIADLLDVSRIEARRLTLQREQIDLPRLVQDIVQRTEELTKGHPVKVEVRDGIPRIEVDPDRAEQILVNLLSNAGKYSYPDTEITVEVERRGNDVMVSVTNLGPGVLPEDQENLFTRFHRTRQAKEEKVPGLGLGLYIAKGLVEAHGGRIWIESEPRNFATFRLTLPLD